jgi:hypothetical protein
LSPEDRRLALVDLCERGRQLAAPLLASARDRELWVAGALAKTLRSQAGIATSHCRPKLGDHAHKEKPGRVPHC